MADSQGRLGRVWHEGSELLVRDLTRAGAYAGRVDLSSAAAGGESTLTVQVRDLALWAAIALGLGLVASAWLERTATYALPRRRLEVRLRRLQEEAQASQNAARRNLPPAWPFGQQVFEAYTAHPDSLLNKAAREVLARFDAAQTLEERSRWGPNGDETKKLGAYPEALVKLNDRAVAAFAQLKNLADLDGQPNHQRWGLAFDQTPAHQAALDAIRPAVITSAAGLEQRAGQQRGAIQWLNDFRQVYTFVAGVLAGITHPNAQAPFINLLQYLYGPHVTGPDVLPILREQAHALALELSRGSVPFGGAKAPASRLTTPAAALPDWAGLLSGAPLADISTASAAELQEALRGLESAFNWLAAVAVFATGMLTLYYPKPAFGSLADYLSLLLWGVTVKAGVELARTILPPFFGRS